MKVEPAIPPAPQEIVEQESEVPIPGTPEPAQQEKIIEFLYDLFQNGGTLNNEDDKPPLEPAP